MSRLMNGEYDQHDTYRMPQAELKAHLKRVIAADERMANEDDLLKQLEDETVFYADTLTLEYHTARIENVNFIWAERPEETYQN